MSEKETLAGVGILLRAGFHLICPWLVHGEQCATCPMGGAGKKCTFVDIADRIDAATE